MASSIFRDTVHTPKQLYKFLMRGCQKLPDGAQQYYKHSIRQNSLQSFKQHVFEPDPERVRQIMDKALYDAEWVLKKYQIILPMGLKKN